MLSKSFQRIDMFKKTMDASWLKNEAISHNLSNVNTPGYKRQTVNFESILSDYLQLGPQTHMNLTHEKHMSINGPQGLTPRIETVSDTSYRTDQNNVNVDIEMSELAKNQIKYNALTDQVNAQISRLKTVVKGIR